MVRLAAEHEAFRRSVLTFGAREIAPIAADVDRKDQLPPEIVERFVDLGLVQLMIPERFGGPGADLTSVCVAREAVAESGSMALAQLAGQNGIVAYPLLAYGSREQQERFLPELAKGAIACVCLSEAGAGSDPTVMTTRARRDGGSWVVTGQKSWISYGKAARYALIFARTGEPVPGRGGGSGISAFLVETDSPGFIEGRHNVKMGGRGIPNVELFFDELRVPTENMLGDEGDGFRAAMRALHLMRPPIGAIAVGGAQAAFSYARDYAKQRYQGRHSLVEYQGLRWMLADMATRLEAARCLLYECVRQVDEGAPLDSIATLSSMVKWMTAETAMRVTTDAVQVLGAAGYMDDHPVERYMRDAKLTTIYEGTSQIQLNTIARGLIRSATARRPSGTGPATDASTTDRSR